jgi:hypothetical protein
LNGAGEENPRPTAVEKLIEEQAAADLSMKCLATPSHSLRWTWIVGLLVFTAYFLAARTMSPGWDEGYTWKRIDALEPWVKRWFQPGVSTSDQFSAAMLSRHWQFSREEPDGHGPFYALLSYAGHSLTRGFLSPPLSYRVGSIALFAFACAMLFRCLNARWGIGPALVSVGLLATQPRILPEVCFGVVDGPLLSLAMLTYCGFLGAMDRPTIWRIAGFGIPAGVAMATKLTGWVLLGPYFAFAALWFLFQSDGRPLKALAWGLLVAAATCLILNVGWWPNPINGVTRFFRSNLTRSETTHIPNYFMGRTYDFALPWYNTLVWTFVAVPILTLILGVGGFLRLLAGWNKPALLLAALVWAAIMVVRALPQAPGHDGVRQIIVAFAMLSVAGGGAVVVLQEWFGSIRGGLVGGLAVLGAAGSCWNYHPIELSYFSPVVGGLQGASRNFEPTYFWDALTPDAVEWLNENTPPGRSILFASNPENWKYIYRWRMLKSPPHSPDLDEKNIQPTWYVLQHRTAMLRDDDRLLIETEEPAYRVSKFGVPLVSIYSIEQYRRARSATR